MKHLIKIDFTAHGTLSVRHAGNDSQYCEAGETVTLKWQPQAGWGLQEAHYTDAFGNVVPIEGGEFTMPDSAIVIGATFMRFVVGEWTEGINPNVGAAFVCGQFGQPVTGGLNLGAVDHLPILTEDDAGAMAYDKGLGVPVFWDGQDWKSVVDGSTVTPHYLRFDSAGTSLIKTGHSGGGIEYSLDNGKTWQPMQKNVFISFSTILLCGNVTALDGSFVFEGNAVDASGDVTSLVNGRGGDVELGANAFALAFYNCKELRTAPNCPSTTLGNRAYQSMFSGCSNIAAFHFATLNTSKNVFADCSSATALTIDVVVPPTIEATTIAGLKADCAILVPAASVDDYKAAQYWSDRADYIQAQS